MAIPKGWSQRTNPQEYEAILDLGNFDKYEINVNVQTGQRQIYSINNITQGRTFVGTINADGTIVKQTGWNNISNLTNGQSRLKEIVDASRTASNKIVASVGTEEQKRRLAEQKEFASLKGSQQPPPGRPPGSPDDGSNPANPVEGGAGSVASAVKFSENTSKFGTKQKYESETLVYPSNYNKKQDTLRITQFKYVTADVFGGELDTSNTGKILEGVDLSARTFTESFGTVFLPMPNNISESNETGWGSNELSTLTAAALGASIKGVASITDFDLSGLGGALGGLGGIRGGAAKKTILDLATLRAGAGVVSKFGLNVDPAAYLSRATGTVVNPNLELLFTGPKLRSFNYQIKMSPRNNNDAKNIRSIIKFFKKGMAPQRSTSGSNGFFLGAPNVFQIKFFSGGSEIRSLGQIRMCALTNFNVDYTPDGNYAAFNDPNAGGSQPVSTNITLTFTELTPIYEDDYNADDHTGFGDEYDPSKITSQGLVGDTPPQDPNPTGKEPSGSRTSGGGASSPVSDATRVLQPGGPTATPGVDFNPNRPGTTGVGPATLPPA